MKRFAAYSIVAMSAFSLSSFAQQTSYAVANTKTTKAAAKPDKPKENMVIVGYCVEEVINMPFGSRTTTYEVPKEDMVNTYDLGPHNTRKVTPIYGRPKVKETSAVLPSKNIAETNNQTVQPIKVEVTAPAYSGKMISVDIVDTYANVLDKGYKSVEMLKRVADKFYFANDFENAVKQYTELLNLDSNVEAVYYFRCAQSLKAIKQNDKADEMMKLFEEKNK